MSNSTHPFIQEYKMKSLPVGSTHTKAQLSNNQVYFIHLKLLFQ